MESVLQKKLVEMQKLWGCCCTLWFPPTLAETPRLSSHHSYRHNIPIFDWGFANLPNLTRWSNPKLFMVMPPGVAGFAMQAILWLFRDPPTCGIFCILHRLAWNFAAVSFSTDLLVLPPAHMAFFSLIFAKFLNFEWWWARSWEFIAPFWYKFCITANIESSIGYWKTQTNKLLDKLAHLVGYSTKINGVFKTGLKSYEKARQNIFVYFHVPSKITYISQ